jgi:hypothetical protein
MEGAAQAVESVRDQIGIAVSDHQRRSYDPVEALRRGR